MKVDDTEQQVAPFHRRFATSDPERAALVIRESYPVSGVQTSPGSEGFHFAQEVLEGVGYALTRFRCTTEIGYEGPLGGLFCVVQVYAGRVSFRNSHGELHTGAGDLCLVPPDEPWRATSTPDVDLAPLVLDRDAVSAHAATVCGTEPDDLVFTGVEPVSSHAAAYWNDTVRHVRDHVFGNPEIAGSALVRGEAFRTLATGLLTVFPNTGLDALEDGAEPGSTAAAPAVLRRAIEFMDAHARDDIGITQIADAARIGPRGLQAAFRRHRDQTPLAYLRRVRMDGAHRDLQTADPTRGDTVSAIAAEWGFANAGRFSVEYRRAHGCSPSRTLRR